MNDTGKSELPSFAMQSLAKRKEKFRPESTPKALRAQVEELQLADLVGDFGFLSRRALDLRLQRIAERMIMGNLDEIPGLVIAHADVDGLKLINGVGGKAKGHDMGDAALINVADKLSRVRPGDILARIGGDEFGTIMPATSLESARLIMEGGVDHDGYIPRTKAAVSLGLEELKHRFGERWIPDTKEKQPGNVSIGWAYMSREDFMEAHDRWQKDIVNQLPGTGDFVTFVFNAADKAMFERKANV